MDHDDQNVMVELPLSEVSEALPQEPEGENEGLVSSFSPVSPPVRSPKGKAKGKPEWA